MPSSYRSLLVILENAIFIQAILLLQCHLNTGHNWWLERIPSSYRSLVGVIENAIFIQVTLVVVIENDIFLQVTSGGHRELLFHTGHYWWSQRMESSFRLH